MSICESTLLNIKNIDSYLARFPTADQKSAAVEMLISRAIAFMFHLPFYTSETNDMAVEHKVVWNGRGETAPVCGPSGGSDTNVYARDSDILVEITQRTKANQWKLEFGPGLRHMEEYIAETKKLRDEIYLFLVAPKIHVDTYNSIRQKQIEGMNIVPLTFNDVEKMTEVCDLTIGLRHIDLTNLFDTLSRNIIQNADFETYFAESSECILKWRASFLRNDRLAFLGIKGYKVFKEKGQEMMTASDIVTELITRPDVRLYFDIIGQEPNRNDLYNGMLTFGFAYESGLPRPDPILSVASELDIEKRMKEILGRIKEP